MRKLSILLTLALLASSASAASMGLVSALSSAFKSGKDLSDARATLYTAQADLAAKKADPGTLILALEQSQNSFDLNQMRLSYTRLQVTQAVLNNYAALLEGQNTVEQAEAQLALDKRNLDVAQAKLAARNATALDVSNSQNTFNTSVQTLANSRAQLPVLSAKLAQSIGLGTATELTAQDYPKLPELVASLVDLEKGLETRNPSVMQAAQQLEIAKLNVRLADNEWTPARTLEDARTSQETAQRMLESSQKDALTTLRDAYRSAQDADKRLDLAQKSLANQQTALAQDQTRFKSGTISRVQLQGSEVSLKNAQVSLDRARGTYLRALAALAVASGRDVTGWVEVATRG